MVVCVLVVGFQIDALLVSWCRLIFSVACRPLVGVDELSSLVLPSWRVGDLLFLLEQRMLLLGLSPAT